MKKTQTWHHTPLGGVVLWLGSIQFAVPVLVLVAIALGVGTFLESTQNVRVARQYVYGSWWFLGVMALVCVSLIFAVISRYPWKRRHVGFITVHAALVTLIGAGFWSMFERVEGHLALQEGTQGSIMDTAEEQIEVLEHAGGDFTSLDHAPAPSGAATLTLAGTRVTVLERWENSREEETVADDSPEPLRAIEIAPISDQRTAWVGEEGKAGPAPVLLGLKVLVLPEGSNWQPPPPPTGAKGEFAFSVAGGRFPLKDAGQEIFPGWKMVEVKRFERAVVAGDSIAEGPQGSPANVAVQVRIADGRGTVEQHTAFEKFPDMVMGKVVEGTTGSGAKLSASAGSAQETLVIFGTVAQTKIGYIAPDGQTKVVEAEARYPMEVQFDTRTVTILRQLARAHQTNSVVRAPIAKDNRPALLVRVGDDTSLVTLGWKAMAHVPLAGGKTGVLHFGPKRVQLPFVVRLADFRKTDYPGTDMAMAYESDVGISLPGEPEVPFTIYMNHPYVHGPWKVYQSGFMGENLSIFSIMHDPGLPLTYISSVALCVGVLITFYARSLSWGHPGIPIRPDAMESNHASSNPVGSVVVPAARREPVGSA